MTWFEEERRDEYGELPTKLTLESRELCSKWGFNDGDEPDWVADIFYDGKDPTRYWRRTLARLAETYLIPKILGQVETYFIHTIHNPIRMRSYNGEEVDCFGGKNEFVPNVSVVVSPRIIVETVVDVIRDKNDPRCDD